MTDKVPRTETRAADGGADQPAIPDVRDVSKDDSVGGVNLASARVLLVIAALVVWEAVSYYGVVDPFFISSPSGVVERFGEWVASGKFFTDARATLTVILSGWVVSAIVGTFLGFVVASSRYIDDIAAPFIDALLAAPRVALAPLFILWLGIGFASKFGLILVENIIIGLIAAASAAKSVDRELILVGRTLGAGPWTRATKIILPWSLPLVFGGLRLALAYAFAGGVLVELIGSTEGLGNFMARAEGTLDTDGVITAILVVVLLASIANWLLRVAEKRLLRWRPADPGLLGSP